MGIDLSTADKDELERAKMMLDIAKMQQDLELDKARWEVERQERAERWAVERIKLEKQNRVYPWLQILTIISAGGFLTFVVALFGLLSRSFGAS